MIDQWLYTHIAISGDPLLLGSLLREQGPALLRAGLGVDRQESESFELEVLCGEGPSAERLTVEVITGPTQLRGTHVRIPVSWSPQQPDAFSTLDGEVTFEPAGDDGGELGLFGRYSASTHQPPAAVMAATRATARRLLRAVAMEVGRVTQPRLSEPQGVRPARLRVRDLMTPDPVTVRTGTPPVTAALVLLHHQIGGVPVVDVDGSLVGVLSESDLLVREAAPRQRRGAAARQEAAKRRAATAGQACTRPPVTVAPDTSLQEAARLLLDYDISRLVVMDGDRLVGMLTRHDVLKALTRPPAELQASVDAVLEDADPAVHGEVTAAGIVRLAGTVPSGSAAARIEHDIRSLDGVVEVINGLEWRQHDDAGARGARQAHR